MNQPPPKILYVITKSSPYGGAQKYVFDVASGAKKAGYEVMVACGGDGPLVKKLESEDIKVHSLQNFKRDVSFFTDLMALLEIIKLIIKIKPDVLHVSSSKAGALGALAGRITLTKRIVFTSHGLTEDEVWRPVWQRKLISLFTWLTLTLSHQTIMISTETYQRSLTKFGQKNKITLVRNGIGDITFLAQKEARKELINLPKNSVWIGGIGELHPNKNWASLIKATAVLPKNVHVIIIGEGEEREKLEKLIDEEHLSSRVHLLGYLDGAKYLHALDIFVLPSLKEGLPYVLLEAGLASLPVVASDLPGNHDIINTGETGFLIEPNRELLSTTLSMLVRDEGMRRRLGANLEREVRDKFSIDRMLKETFRVYD